MFIATHDHSTIRPNQGRTNQNLKCYHLMTSSKSDKSPPNQFESGHDFKHSEKGLAQPANLYRTRLGMRPIITKPFCIATKGLSISIFKQLRNRSSKC
ncbi:hypothetical protein D3C86_173000 [compost metagenome]